MVKEWCSHWFSQWVFHRAGYSLSSNCSQRFLVLLPCARTVSLERLLWLLTFSEAISALLSSYHLIKYKQKIAMSNHLVRLKPEYIFCQRLPVRKSLNDPFEIYSWTMKMVFPACWLWSWLLAMQCPRTLTKCICLSFDKTSICWAKLCGKLLCFSLIHLTVTAMPSLRQPLYNCWNTTKHRWIRLFSHIVHVMFVFFCFFTCSENRLAASKSLVASSRSSKEKIRYGGKPITADLIVCGTRPTLNSLYVNKEQNSLVLDFKIIGFGYLNLVMT